MEYAMYKILWDSLKEVLSKYQGTDFVDKTIQIIVGLMEEQEAEARDIMAEAEKSVAFGRVIGSLDKLAQKGE